MLQIAFLKARVQVIHLKLAPRYISSVQGIPINVERQILIHYHKES